MKRIWSFAAIFGAIVLCGASAWGYTVTYDPGTLQRIDGISQYATTGALMAGMEVTVTYSDMTTNTAFWGVTGADSGGASGTGWSLSVTGDTYNPVGVWNLDLESGYSISKIYIAGLPGETFFDVYTGIDDEFDTPYSMYGRPFRADWAGYGGVDVTATYYNLVAVGSSDPVGDLYADLEIVFAEAYTASHYAFYADSDNTNAVPLPASALLLASGLLGVLGFARRRSA